AGRGEERLHLRRPEGFDDRRLALLELRRAEEGGVEADQATQTREGDDPAQRKPHLEARDRVAPGAAGLELHRPYRAQEPGGKECDRKAKRDTGQPAYRTPT